MLFLDRGKLKNKKEKMSRPALISSFSSTKRLGVLLLLLDGMLVYRRVTSSIKFAGTHLYTRMERGTVTSIQSGLFVKSDFWLFSFRVLYTHGTLKPRSFRNSVLYYGCSNFHPFPIQRRFKITSLFLIFGLLHFFSLMTYPPLGVECPF